MSRIDAESETLLPCIGVDEEQNAAVELMGCLKARREGGGQEAFVAHSLRAEGHDASEHGTGRGTPLVVAFAQNSRDEVRLQAGDGSIVGALAAEAGMKQTSYVAVGFYGNDSGNDAALELCPTLRAMPGGGGNHPAVAIPAGALRQNPDSGPDGVGVQEHIAYTLEARAEVEAVAFQEAQTGVREYDTAGTLRADGPGHDPVGTRVREGMAVRRLTPVECEILMGFPPGYTAIPSAADGPRYRALGNSMAVPVMAWIGRRIQSV